MAGRKKRPVLYEVVNRSRRARGQKSAWQAASQRTTQSAPEKTPPPAPAAPVAPEPAPASPPQPAPARVPPKSTTDSAAAVRVSDGRLHLLLGWPQLVVAGVVLLAVVIGVFQAGRRSALPATETGADASPLFAEGPQSTAEAAHAERQVPSIELSPGRRGNGSTVATPVGSNERAEPRRAARPQARRSEPPPQQTTAPPRPAFEFEPGKYYILVQYFPLRRRAHAESAAEFLRANGVDCAVRQAPNDLRLFATQACANPREAQQLRARIVKLGEEYARQGGGYDFAGAEPHKIRADEE